MENKISVSQLDVLREIGTIGAGRAATALADLLNTKVEISLPETKLIALENLDRILGDPEKPLFVMDTGLQGDIGGRILFLITPRDACLLSGLLMRIDPGTINQEDPLFKSSLTELVNIITGAHMNALSDITGLCILYNVPSLALDMVAALLDFIFIQVAQHSEEALYVKTLLSVKQYDLEGIFLFFPDEPSLKKIFQALGI